MKRPVGARKLAGPLALAAVLAAAAPLARGAPPSRVTAEADGILAELDVDATGADVGWRFLRRPPAPISRIDASLNTRPLGAPQQGLAPFPGPGQSAALLCLIDRSGTDRTAAVDAAESAASTLPALLPQGVRVSTAHSDEADSSTPPASATPGAVLPGGLAAAMRQAIDKLGAQPADRHALLVFTDGFSREPAALDDLAPVALSRAVAIYFVITPSMRLADIARLERLAQATRGGMIDPAADLASALTRTILSGAQLHFPFGPTARFFWERQARIDVALGYGTHELDLSTDLDVPAAGWRETLNALWERSAPRLPAFLAGLCVGLLGWIGTSLLRRPRRPAGVRRSRSSRP